MLHNKIAMAEKKTRLRPETDWWKVFCCTATEPVSLSDECHESSPTNRRIIPMRSMCGVVLSHRKRIKSSIHSTNLSADCISMAVIILSPSFSSFIAAQSRYRNYSTLIGVINRLWAIDALSNGQHALQPSETARWWTNKEEPTEGLLDSLSYVLLLTKSNTRFGMQSHLIITDWQRTDTLPSCLCPRSELSLQSFALVVP